MLMVETECSLVAGFELLLTYVSAARRYSIHCRHVDEGKNPTGYTKELFGRGVSANQAAKGKVSAVQTLRLVL